MPGPVRVFADHQPVTSIMNSIRALFESRPMGSDLGIALAWIVGLLGVACTLSVMIYHRRIS